MLEMITAAVMLVVLTAIVVYVFVEAGKSSHTTRMH